MQTKDKNKIKIALDIIMALVFAILFNKAALGGLAFHETAGLAVGAFIILHKVLNWAWIKGVTKRLFDPKLPFLTRAAYIVDILLLICVAVIIVTGILMSKVLFANLISVRLNVEALHKAVSYIALMLIGVHVGLSWNRVTSIMKKLLHIPQKRVLGAVATACAVAVFALGSYNIVSMGYFDRVASIASGYSERGEDGQSSFTQGAEIGGGKGWHNGLGGGKGEGGKSGADVLSTIYQNISIMAAFAVFTYYIGKLINGKPKKTGIMTAA